MAFVYDELDMYIWPDPVVMTATVNGPLAAGAMAIPYTLVSGVAANCGPEMTLVGVGCASMGRDARIRIRSIDLVNGVLNVAENGIYWINGGTLRVLKVYEPWSVVPRITVSGGVATFFKDYDIAYTDQTQYPEPVVVMGPDHAGPPGEVVTFDGWNSWGPCGSPLTTVVFASPDGGVDLGGNSWRYDTPGAYVVTGSVTDAQGKVGTGRRHIFIGEPKRNWGFSSFEGARQTGGYTVKCWTTETWTDLHDGALIVLRWKRPGMGSRPYTAFVGYVQESSIKFDYAKQRTEFTAINLSLVLNKLDVFGSSLGFKHSGTFTWTDVRDMDLDSAVAVHLRWHTTVLHIADVRPIVGTYQIQKADFARGGGFSPIREFLRSACRGDVVCDAQGGLWCERDQNTLAVRRGTSYFIEREDWRAEPQIEDSAIPDVSYMEVGGLSWSGATGTVGAYLASVPGPLPDRYGSPEIVEGLALPTAIPQTWLNEIAGYIFADRINKYSRIQIPAATRWTKSDIAPQTWAGVRGFPWLDNARVQVSRIRHAPNARGHSILSDLEAFAETWGSPGYSKAIPVIPDEPPGEPPPPPFIPPPPETIMSDVLLVFNATQIAVSFNAFAIEATVWHNLKIGALAHVDVGTILGACVLDSGEAYCITYKDEFTLPNNGLWYCASVLSPSWSLIQTPTELRTAVGSTDNIYLCSIAARGVDTAFATFGPAWRGAFEVGYVQCAVGVPTWTVAYPNPMFTYQSAHPFTCQYHRLTGAARIGMGYPPAANTAAVADIITGGTTVWLTGHRYAYSVSPTWAVIEYTNLFSYILGADVPPLTPPAFTNVSNTHPVDEMGGFPYWLRTTDNALMVFGTIQGIPNDSGGVDGVFSVSGALPGGFLLVDSAATIIWVAATAAVFNTRRNMAITQDGGFVWRTIDGNFTAACGATWAGGVTQVPMISFARIVTGYE